MNALARPIAGGLSRPITGAASTAQPASTTAAATTTAPVAGPVPAHGMPSPAKAPSLNVSAVLSGRTFNRGNLLDLVAMAEASKARARAAERVQARGEDGEPSDLGMTPDVLRTSLLDYGVEPDYVDLALAEMARQLLDAEQAGERRREVYARCTGISNRVVVNEILARLKEITGDGSHEIKFGRTGRNWSDSTTFEQDQKFEMLKVVRRSERTIVGVIRGGFLWLKKFQVEKVRMEYHDLLEIYFGGFLLCWDRDKNIPITVDVRSPDGFPVLAALTGWLSKVYPHVGVHIRDTPVGD